jgi:ABC-2 type transport system ATP-binding protein
MREDVLSLSAVSVRYRTRGYEKQAVQDISLQVQRQEIFGFLGPNGAGKTTTIKAILNLIPVSTGTIAVFGRDPRERTVRRRLGFMPELARYYGYLSPRELLRMYAGLFGLGRSACSRKIEEVLSLVGLADAGQVLMRHFSKGMMQKVSLAQALINDPELLILDEPTSGLDPLARLNLRTIIKDLQKKGVTIFFSSHELSEVELICDRVGIIHNGRLIAVDRREDILASKGQQRSLEQYFLDIIGGGQHA